MSRCVLGIDTSNYTTSVALIDEDMNIISDKRKLLAVKKGERGLRQQEALFQHIANLPSLIGEAMEESGRPELSAVSSSDRPRPVESSYMPVFNAGNSFAASIAGVLGFEHYTFSHQEGHIAAASYGTGFDRTKRSMAFHLSGGTLEGILLPEHEIAVKTRDISFGQLIDRIGVKMGMDFPCGREMDSLAVSCDSNGEHRSRISIVGTDINISGEETFISRELEQGRLSKEEAARCVFDDISLALSELSENASSEFGVEEFLFAGGVASSRYIRERIRSLTGDKMKIYFGKEELCSDNAVGTAILGDEAVWR